ncbi:MAG: hypothetical protein ACI4LE_05320 [Faecalibacterium sp.]
MRDDLFRKKPLEQISSPDQLGDYLRVSSPAMWMALAAAILLLLGTCVWGVLGRLDTVLQAAAVCDEGRLICYIREADIGQVHEGMEVTLDGSTYTITEIPADPVAADESFSAYALHVGSIQSGEWVYEAALDGRAVEDGVYPAEIVTESIAPKTFVFN